MTILRCLNCNRYGLGSRCQFCGRSLAVEILSVERIPPKDADSVLRFIRSGKGYVPKLDRRPAISEAGGAAWVAIVGALYAFLTWFAGGALALGATGIACVLVTWWLLVRKCRVEG